MPEIDRSLQLRAFLNEWATVLIIVLLIASAGVGWWAYQINLEPSVETEQRLTEQWSESTAYSHSAPITNDSLPFAAGERASNRPRLPPASAPAIDHCTTHVSPRSWMAPTGMSTPPTAEALR